MKQVSLVVLVIIAVIAGAVVFGKKDKAQGTPSNNVYGTDNPIVTITEYGDFECPACAGFFPIVSQIKEKFADKVRFQFKHFPLAQIHPNTTAAHRAAEAAAAQGKFWDMHDMLYEQQASWRSSGAVSHSGAPISTNNPTAIFETYAKELGLDIDKYNNDVKSSHVLDTINADVAEGKALNVSGTPTYFIDGVVVEDLNSISTEESFSAVVQNIIDAKSNHSESPETQSDAIENQPAKQPENN